MRQLIFCLVVLLLSLPAYALRWKQETPSTHVVDVTLTKDSSNYRRALVFLTEAVGNAVGLANDASQNPSCAPLAADAPKLEGFRQMVQEREPTDDLPGEKELYFNPEAFKKFMASEPCADAVAAKLAEVKNKQAATERAARDLKVLYAPAYETARGLMREIQAQDFSSCGPGPAKSGPTPTTPTVGTALTRAYHGWFDDVLAQAAVAAYHSQFEGAPGHFVQGYEAVSGTIQQNADSLAQAEATLEATQARSCR